MRKNIVKKTLAAGMLALMTCTSMSAMAEKQFIWAGEVCDTNACVFKGFDAVCRHAVGVRNAIGGSAWPVTYLGSWTITGDYSLHCAADNKLDNRNFVATSFRCSRFLSYFSMDRPDGCYFNMDCDAKTYPDGVPFEGCPTPEPEHCPPKFPQNPEECSIAEKGFDFGGVVCNKDGSPFKDGSMFKVCIWPENIGYLFKTEDCQAQEIIARCISQHEQKHIDYGGICNEKNRQAASRYEDRKTDGYKLEESEIIAYHDTMGCFADVISTCKTTACREGVKDAGDVVRDRIVEHLFQWEQWNKTEAGDGAVSIPSDYYNFPAIDVNK